LLSVNRTMAALHGNPYVKVPSPSKVLGIRRTSVRRSVPQGQDRKQVNSLTMAPRPRALPGITIASLRRSKTFHHVVAFCYAAE
jgi:hypothetical protein